MKTICRIFVIAAVMLSHPALYAQASIDLDVFTRVEYQVAGEIKARNLYVQAVGDIGHGFSYGLNQRFDKFPKADGLLDATDWVYIRYTTPNGKWMFSGGKDVIAVGGMEYKENPIDVHFYSGFCNNIVGCFQLAASASYMPNPNDIFICQVSHTPFHVAGDKLYAYNFRWRGTHGIWSTSYSVNLVQDPEFSYVAYAAIGNRFSFLGFDLDIDYTLRALPSNFSLIKDFTAGCKLAWSYGKSLVLFAKAYYDRNMGDLAYDHLFELDTAYATLGGGVEYYPLKKDNIRIYSYYCNIAGANTVALGVKWRIDVLTL